MKVLDRIVKLFRKAPPPPTPEELRLMRARAIAQEHCDNLNAWQKEAFKGMEGYKPYEVTDEAVQAIARTLPLRYPSDSSP